MQPKFLITIDQFPHNKQTIHLLENIKYITDGKFKDTLFPQNLLYFIKLKLKHCSN